jgi:hypothetical protein
MAVLRLKLSRPLAVDGKAVQSDVSLFLVEVHRLPSIPPTRAQKLLGAVAWGVALYLLVSAPKPLA